MLKIAARVYQLEVVEEKATAPVTDDKAAAMAKKVDLQEPCLRQFPKMGSAGSIDVV